MEEGRGKYPIMLAVPVFFGRFSFLASFLVEFDFPFLVPCTRHLADDGVVLIWL